MNVKLLNYLEQVTNIEVFILFYLNMHFVKTKTFVANSIGKKI